MDVSSGIARGGGGAPGPRPPLNFPHTNMFKQVSKSYHRELAGHLKSSILYKLIFPPSIVKHILLAPPSYKYESERANGTMTYCGIDLQ